MRFIKKSKEPEKFTKWKNQANENWEPHFEELSGEVKQAVYDSLLKEQRYICCYCERRLEDDDYHIEHLVPQSDSKINPLDYSNFLCSCLRNTKKGEPLHCGLLKADRRIKIHPLQKDCQSKFIYTADGNMKGIDKDAEETITILGLNIPKLRNLRKKVLEPFLDENINENELEKFVAAYLKPDKEGKYNPFISFIEFIFKFIEPQTDTDTDIFG